MLTTIRTALSARGRALVLGLGAWCLGIVVAVALLPAPRLLGVLIGFAALGAVGWLGWIRRREPLRDRDVAPILLGCAVVALAASQLATSIGPGGSGSIWLAAIGLGCLLLAILGLPTRPLAWLARLRTVVDGIMVVVAALACGWYVWLGPDLDRTSLPFSRLFTPPPIVGTDALLLVSASFLAPYLPFAFRRVALPALAALLLTSIATVSADPSADGTPAGTVLLVVLWCVSWALLFLAVGLARTRDTGADPGATDDQEDRPAEQRPGWAVALPNLPILAAGGLLVAAERSPGLATTAAGMIVGLAVLVIAALLRQSLALLEEGQRLDAALRANRRLTVASTTDPVTGLLNRRALQQAMDTELARSRRTGRPFAVVLCDVEDVTRYQPDALGRLARDALLHEVGRVIERQVRIGDLVGRWQGDQFLVILLETGHDGAQIVAERIRAAFERRRFARGTRQLSCSIGLAVYPRDADGREDLLLRAEGAAGAARQGGDQPVRRADELVVHRFVREEADPANGAATALGTVAALEAVIEARDPASRALLRQSRALALRLAVVLGLDAQQTRALDLAAAIHDVGKVALPDAILAKAGPLGEAEWEQVRDHARLGADIVARIPSLRPLAPILRAHHEHFDGQGYPAGLAGRAIPFLARIIAVTDAFAAMTTPRPHRPAISPAEALAEIQRQTGRQFDPDVARALERLYKVEHASARAEAASDGDADALATGGGSTESRDGADEAPLVPTPSSGGG